MTKKIIGHDADQVPVNGFLGNLAYVDEKQLEDRISFTEKSKNEIAQGFIQREGLRGDFDVDLAVAIELNLIGYPVAGGFYAGMIDTTTAGSIQSDDDYQTGLRYALIVSPKSLTGGNGANSVITAEGLSTTNKVWDTERGEAEPGCLTRWNGLESTNTLIAKDDPRYEAFNFISDVRSLYPAPDITGGSQWYLPAMDELELLYRNFKARDRDNNTTVRSSEFPGTNPSGFNPSSNPQGFQYENSPRIPDVTYLDAFKVNGSQALDVSPRYWSSTDGGGTDNAWTLDVDTAPGFTFTIGKYLTSGSIRPVRRVVLDGDTARKFSGSITGTVTYDNSSSDLAATNLQDAVDELDAVKVEQEAVAQAEANAITYTDDQIDQTKSELSIETQEEYAQIAQGFIQREGLRGDFDVDLAVAIEMNLIGAPVAGGFYGGMIDTTGDGVIQDNDDYQSGQRYALIVSPKKFEAGRDTSPAPGLPTGDLEFNTATYGGGPMPGTLTRWNGLDATDSIIAENNSRYEVANYIADLRNLYPATSIANGSQWYIPAIDELEILYRNLKPTEDDNNTGSRTEDFPGVQDYGYNPSSNPEGSGYSNSPRVPDVTLIEDFKDGGPQTLAFTKMWSVTEANDIGDGWSQNFFSGGQGANTRDYPNGRIRPVRRVVLDGDTTRKRSGDYKFSGSLDVSSDINLKGTFYSPSQDAIQVTESNRPRIRPSLNLDFANAKVLDPRISYSRSSSGTYYDGKTFAVSEQNLYGSSEDFNTWWGKNSITVVSDATTSPDGVTGADKIVGGSADNRTYLNKLFYFYPPPPVTLAGSTVSVYAKAAEFNTLFVVQGGFDLNLHVRFDLESGAIGLNSDATKLVPSIEDVGNGWYRCIVTFNTDTPSWAPAFFPSSNKGTTPRDGNVPDDTSGIYLWGAQYELRPQATPYVKTENGKPLTRFVPKLLEAPADTPRFDHDPVTGESKGLLIEEQRTNLFAYSEDFFNTYWDKVRASIESNTVIAPDGTLTADKLVDSTDNSSHFIFAGPFGLSGTYTLSAYAKKAELSYIFLKFDSTGGDGSFGGGGAYFDLVNGTVESFSSETATIFDAGNGWYRCIITGTGSSTATPYIAPANDSPSIGYSGDGTSGIYIWGAQLEEGSIPTSYIKTEGSQVTRLKDTQSVDNLGQVGEGTLYIESQSGADEDLIDFSTNASIDSWDSWLPNPINERYPLSLNSPDDGLNKISVAYDESDTRTSINGETIEVSNDSRGGTDISIGNTMNGHIRKLSLYPQKLSDAVIQSLTANK